MQADIAKEVRKFIESSFLFREDCAALPNDTSLLDAGLIDSTGVLELVAFLESNFGIHVADADIVPENLDSINSIVGFVAAKMSEAPAAA